jgi:hypothetical protein
MKLSVRRLGVLAVVITAAVAGRAAANHSWNGYHWARTGSSFVLLAGDNVDSAWDAYLIGAAADWSKSTVLDLDVVGGNNPRPKNCRPTSGRIEVCNAAYGGTGWLGIAQIWLSGKHITQGVAKMNDTYFQTSTYNRPAWRRLVMCQEVAHDFGLDHQDENFNNPNLGTCMDYTSNPAGPPSNEHPNSHDYAELQTIYSHIDGSTTVGAFTAPAEAADRNAAAEWGRRVHRSPNGRVEDYELDLGNGRRLITHVLWADPDADARRNR